MVRKSKKSSFKSEIFQTENINVRCTKLPEFIRAKKYLGSPFCVYFNNMVSDGVKVTIKASNYKNPHAELKNNESSVRNGVAEFCDLRFNGKSGRGIFWLFNIGLIKSFFHVFITRNSRNQI